ncbi:MAG: hypothetical protein HY815_03040 [Candidatus Riflebacteria bacterium]|nr:hypothetical protein [Candidatus Riflebacteria bacterium]
MSCPDTDAVILALTDAGDLEKKAEARRHLESCPACRDEFEALAQVQAALRLTTPLPPADLVDRTVQRALSDERGRGRPVPLIARLATLVRLTALAATAAVCLVFFTHPSARELAGLSARELDADTGLLKLEGEVERLAGGLTVYDLLYRRDRDLDLSLDATESRTDLLKLIDGTTGRPGEQDPLAAAERELSETL